MNKKKLLQLRTRSHGAELGPKVWDGCVETSARPSFTSNPGSHVVVGCNEKEM